ncbi:MAG TPA: hypothetical protein VF498_17500, partial [Anaerolineales bacterium]
TARTVKHFKTQTGISRQKRVKLAKYSLIFLRDWMLSVASLKRPNTQNFTDRSPNAFYPHP